MYFIMFLQFWLKVYIIKFMLKRWIKNDEINSLFCSSLSLLPFMWERLSWNSRARNTSASSSVLVWRCWSPYRCETGLQRALGRELISSTFRVMRQSGRLVSWPVYFISVHFLLVSLEHMLLWNYHGHNCFRYGSTQIKNYIIN